MHKRGKFKGVADLVCSDGVFKLRQRRLRAGFVWKWKQIG